MSLEARGNVKARRGHLPSRGERRPAPGASQLAHWGRSTGGGDRRCPPWAESLVGARRSTPDSPRSRARAPAPRRGRGPPGRPSCHATGRSRTTRAAGCSQRTRPLAVADLAAPGAPVAGLLARAHGAHAVGVAPELGQVSPARGALGDVSVVAGMIVRRVHGGYLRTPCGVSPSRARQRSSSRLDVAAATVDENVALGTTRSDLGVGLRSLVLGGLAEHLGGVAVAEVAARLRRPVRRRGLVRRSP